MIMPETVTFNGEDLHILHELSFMALSAMADSVDAITSGFVAIFGSQTLEMTEAELMAHLGKVMDIHRKLCALTHEHTEGESVELSVVPF